MKIVFKNTFKDLIYFNYYIQKRFPMILIHIFLFGLGVLFNINYLLKLRILDFFIAFVIYLFFVYFIMIVFALVLETINHLTGKTKTFLCEHEMTFKEDYIIEKTKFNENKFTWEVLIKIIENKKYFLLFISNVTAHMIPKKELNENEIKELRLILEKQK